MDSYSASRLSLAKRIVAALSFKRAPVYDVTIPGDSRVAVAAVGQYLQGQGRILTGIYQEAAERNYASQHALQAGAGSANAMSELLLALATDDPERASVALQELVAGAINTGVVTV